ncbi:MAG TPA: NAD(P) transhydrogenase subunit alpha [Acidimicrobiia bacterium]|nr:NAD(P) transhydrogenase subunit alpha [Acidimicrobiia bacterium]
MRLGIRSERSDTEHRVAATPASVASLADLGFEVVIESGAGADAGASDEAYADAGAQVVPSMTAGTRVDVLLTVNPPFEGNSDVVADGGAIVGFLEPGLHADAVATLAKRGVRCIAIENLPRSTLAQSMDALSSQATAAGYAAVLLGATTMPKFLPMLVTAAGTVPPARVLILGVGVAGLQAIATARRLGGVVHAYDIRPETREQVESLGAKFVDAPTQEMDEGGYARAVDDDVAMRQREVLTAVVAESDLIITTAQVPGRRAPRLVDEAMVELMRPGSVIIDMAASSGGNVAGSRPDERVEIGGVTILGPTDLASRVAADASRMYARNLLEVVTRMVTDGELSVDPEDPVIGPALIAIGDAP